MTLLAAEPKQFTLKDDGRIYFQADASNPLPGNPIASLKKGDTPLVPSLDLIAVPELADVDTAAATEKLSTWLYLYIARILEPLVKLNAELEGQPAAVSGICLRVHDSLGIIPRTELLDLIDGLDADMRKTLRTRHVKLGPVLVFIPDLNKPAAVRLRALLWSLYHDKPLPAPVPKDGAVSVVVDAAAADPAFFQAIGYPLYANRVIRIDMLDRVISAVYDNVKDNQFTARHEMAEWLGCSIPDLYAVLESMGHRKVFDPAESKAAEQAATASDLVAVVPLPDATTTPALEETAVGTSTSAGEGADTSAAVVPVATSPAPATQKPVLATFRVWWPKKGGVKPAAEPRERKPFAPRDKRDQDSDKKFSDRKPQKHHARREKPSRGDKILRSVSSAPMKTSPEDSPFAILGTLKFKSE